MAKQMAIQCANCGRQFSAIVETLVDGGQDLNAKARLLSGTMNLVSCPNCGYQMAVGTPILYHDASKELLIGFVPMELSINNDQQEKILGDLMRELTQKMPQAAFKGYFLQPRRAMSMQHLIEQVLESDGVTREMIEAQKARAKLIDQMMSAGSMDALTEIVRANDAEIEAGFFQTMTLMAQRLAASGSAEVAQQVMGVQAAVAELSSYGQAALQRARDEEALVERIAREIEDLGEDADRPEFLDMAVRYQNDPTALRALVGLARPVFDDAFFQDMQQEIGRAPADQRDSLNALRGQLQTLIGQVDAQQQETLRAAAQLLQEIVNAQDIDAAVRDYATLIDGTFLAVLEANLQQAQRAGDQQLLERLSEVYARVTAYIEDSMPPALRFINELLSTETDEDAAALLAQQAGQYSEELLATMDAVEGALAQRGDSALLSKLVFLRAQAERALG